MKNILKSIGSISGGFLIVAVLSVVTDLVVEKVGILPPANELSSYMWWHLLIALIYRSIYTLLGGYLTATWAPNHKMRHVIILAVIGTVFGTLGTVANWDKATLSGVWYPVVLLLTSPIFVWLGGKLRVK